MGEQRESGTEMVYNVAGEEVLYTSGRKNLIIEVGHGGSPTPQFGLIRDYLQAEDANFLGIDPDEDATSAQNTTRSEYARSVNADFLNVGDDLKNSADQIWMRNFVIGEDMPWKSDPEHWRKIFGNARNALKENGKLIFTVNYSGYTPQDQINIRNWASEAGFDIEDLDLNTDEHPYVSHYRNLDLKFQRQYTKDAFGFRGTKSKEV